MVTNVIQELYDICDKAYRYDNALRLRDNSTLRTLSLSWRLLLWSTYGIEAFSTSLISYGEWRARQIDTYGLWMEEYANMDAEDHD